MQRHSIILWKKAEKKDKAFDEIAKETYEVLNLFRDCPQELRPNYLTAETKKDIKEFDWNYENFRSTLKKGINKEGENIFEDLGYSISFFSSLNGQNACGFEMIAGNKNEKFHNSLIINLPATVHWINYWSEDIIEAIGMEKIQNVVAKNTMSTFKAGIFSIKETALDIEKEEDIRFHAEVHKQLFLG